MHLKGAPCCALLLPYRRFNPSQWCLLLQTSGIDITIRARVRVTFFYYFFSPAKTLLALCIISNKRKVKNFIIQWHAGIIKGSKVTNRYTLGFNRRNNRLFAELARALGGARRAP